MTLATFELESIQNICYDKSLAYNEPASSLKPITVHKTAKRVSCLTSVKVGSITVTIAGGLHDDDIAFSLQMHEQV